MTTKDVLAAMANGAVLCVGYSDGGKIFWLEPKRTIVPKEIGEAITKLPGLKPGGDRLFDDATSQTWRVA